MKSVHLKAVPDSNSSDKPSSNDHQVPMQPASTEIWDKKYRLKARSGEPVDADIDGTYRRVAEALAEVEQGDEARQYWSERFLWALRHGAIPAGRITSNAGALEHKPATSTINCTVSGTILDSMDNILEKVHEAGLTLKAGCVAPGTWVVTEHGRVTADQAVAERHQSMLCYDREQQRFELRRIEEHLTTQVPRHENIEILSHGASLKTSIKHPVLVYRDGRTRYVRADEVTAQDGLVHHQLDWAATGSEALAAWFAGAHLGDGSACDPALESGGLRGVQRGKWCRKAKARGRRLVFRIRAAEREVVERYARFFASFTDAPAEVIGGVSDSGAAVWDYSASSVPASRAVELIDNQTCVESAAIQVPGWVARQPQQHFLPFLAGVVDTDGAVDRERGLVTIATDSHDFAQQLLGLLGLFGVQGSITRRQPRERVFNGRVIREAGGAMLELADGAFLARVAEHMADNGKRNSLFEHASQGGQHDHYVMPSALSDALQARNDGLTVLERQRLGFYHGHHQARVVSRTWLERWSRSFPELSDLIAFARTLRPVEAIHRGLDLAETFYDFTVERHHNYLAGTGGLVVIHNCGIGYDFSTLRPRGAYVSGAGAYTSGPLSFMDIYDKMCFTVSSAGGRRGAQMGTFDVGHPDVVDFIRAKREDGRLRQFNLSLLITSEFMEAVRKDLTWPLAFPILAKEAEEEDINLRNCEQVTWRDWPVKDGYIVNQAGKVACRIYKRMRARRLWDVIMSSTYDYAEPGFILIDKVNEMNNNWFCEEIRATNPCVTGDTWVHTADGPRQVSELIGRSFTARLQGMDYASGGQGFFATGTKPVLTLRTAEGYRLKLTADHRVRRVTRFTDFQTDTEWCEAGKLQPGDRVLLNNHRPNPAWPGSDAGGGSGGELGEGTGDQGYLMGLLVGEGALAADRAVLSVWGRAAVIGGVDERPSPGAIAIMNRALSAAAGLEPAAATLDWQAVSGGSEHRLQLDGAGALARTLGMTPGNTAITPAVEGRSSAFQVGFLSGLFDADAVVRGSHAAGLCIRLFQSERSRLEAAQRMLLRLGMASRIDRVQGHHELVMCGENLVLFAQRIGFTDPQRQSQLEQVLADQRLELARERFVARVEALEPAGDEPVYDCQVPGVNAFDAGGIVAHNCGEQPLPPYGACLLGSVNLTRFVRDPFTPQARFDWEQMREVVDVFTRMLDNVVDINGLPLGQQRDEIISKRRHGMGYLGLGSTVTMLGMKYGEPDSLEFTERVTRELALQGWRSALDLAREKGPAPIMDQEFEVSSEMLSRRPEMVKDGHQIGDKLPGKLLHARYSHYMQQVATEDPALVDELAEVGARFTHHSSIAPTGTISLSLANNASNGIEPSFAHHYFRNVIKEGKKSKEKVDVFSYELLAYRELIDQGAMPPGAGADADGNLPDYFISADEVSPKAHVDVQAAAQKWIDSSISKTANVPTDYPYEDFKDIYLYAYEQGLKGCTTFRFNPEAFQGVLVKEQDLENTTYRFTLGDGSTLEVKGNEEIEYDGETHTAANLFDALKEGYYGKF